MEAKMVFLFALLAPVLMSAAGIFTHRRGTAAETGSDR
jgi:hypothetical protein